ncbi:MAG: hypothetical protein NTAFB01_02760 [Nitrospira sp.]
MLRCAKVRDVQPGICLKDPHQAVARQWLPTEERLGTNENIPRARPDTFPQSLSRCRMPECVAIEPGDFSPLEETTNFRFNTLGAITDRTHTGSTAQRAEIRQSICLTTVTTDHPAGFTIIGKRHDTGIALRNPATVSTNQGPSITFPIEEEQDLGMVL